MTRGTSCLATPPSSVHRLRSTPKPFSAPKRLNSSARVQDDSEIDIAPRPDHIEQIWLASDRPIRRAHEPAEHAGPRPPRRTGYVSILPVDQGSSTLPASFAPNPAYFDPENIVRLAPRAVQRRGLDARRARDRGLKYAHRFRSAEVNHNEFLSPEQLRPDCLRASAGIRMGVGATIYFGWRSRSGRSRSHRDVPARPRARHVHRALVLPEEPRSRRTPTTTWRRILPAANHLGVTIGADIISRSCRRTTAGTQPSTSARRTRRSIRFTTNHPIDLTLPGRQLLHGARGPDQLGGASAGRATQGCCQDRGSTSARRDGADFGRKAFQRPLNEGVGLLNDQTSIEPLDHDRLNSSTSTAETAASTSGRSAAAARLPQSARVAWPDAPA